MSNLFNKLILHQSNNMLVQFFRFALTGLFVEAVDTTIFYGLSVFLGVYFILSNIFSFLVGAATEYMISRRWVFHNNNKRQIKDFLFFSACSAVSLFISIGLLYILIERSVIKLFVSNMDYNRMLLYSKIITIVIIALLDFVLKKFFVFGKSKEVNS